MHPYLTPATRQLVIDAGLEMEVEFWTHHASTWACVRQQFKNMVIALDQHGQHLTPGMAYNPPQFVLDFECLAIHPQSNLTVHQAARKLGWNQPAVSCCCWWGKVAGAPGILHRYYGGFPPPLALNVYICRQVQKTTGTGSVQIPWWGAGLDYNKITQIQQESLIH